MEAHEFIASMVARGWTQSQIAECTGIPQPTLSKVVRRDVKDVLSASYRKLQALHDAVLARAAEGLPEVHGDWVREVAYPAPESAEAKAGA